MDTKKATAQKHDPSRLRFSVSLVSQGKHSFYTLTIPSEVLARTCAVTSRKEDPKKGFQRELDSKRADEIARYIDQGGTIPNSIVLSAQEAANLTIVGKGKTLEFTDTPGAFLILDGQHRVYGFSKAKTELRVPVVIYNGLSRKEESRLFIDINTKQRPVPTQLLLDIKQLAEIEDEDEAALRALFDFFHETPSSALKDMTSPFETLAGKVSRVTFNHAMKPLLSFFVGREPEEIFQILNNYLIAIRSIMDERFGETVLAKAVIFRAVMSLFPSVVQRVQDKFGGEYSPKNFVEIAEPVFSNVPKKKFEIPGTSWTNLRDYLEERLKKKLTI